MLQHPKTGYYYIVRKIQNKSGSNTEKFLKVNQNNIPIKNGNEFIYLNKNSGEPINKNGRKYVVNNLTKELVKTKYGYIKKEEESNIQFPRRISQTNQLTKTNQPILPPPDMMRIEQDNGTGGFKYNRKKPTHQLVPRKSNHTRSFLNSGPAPQTIQQTPPGMIRIDQDHGTGGFKYNRKKPTHQFVISTSGSAGKSN